MFTVSYSFKMLGDFHVVVCQTRVPGDTPEEAAEVVLSALEKRLGPEFCSAAATFEVIHVEREEVIH